MAVGIFTVCERKSRSDDRRTTCLSIRGHSVIEGRDFCSKCHCERSKSNGEIVESSIITKSRARAYGSITLTLSQPIAGVSTTITLVIAHRMLCLVYSRDNDGEILHHNCSIIYAAYRSSISDTCSSRTDFAITTAISAFRIAQPYRPY